MKLVLDTNILISAFVFPGGKPEAVYGLLLEGAAELTTTRTLLAEFGRILEEKFGWEADRTEEAVRQLARLGSVEQPVEEVRLVEQDPADNRVLEAAIAGGATHIVSGDHHLLELESFRGIPIVTAAALLEMVGK